MKRFMKFRVLKKLIFYSILLNGFIFLSTFSQAIGPEFIERYEALRREMKAHHGLSAQRQQLFDAECDQYFRDHQLGDSNWFKSDFFTHKKGVKKLLQSIKVLKENYQALRDAIDPTEQNDYHALIIQSKKIVRLGIHDILTETEISPDAYTAFLNSATTEESVVQKLKVESADCEGRPFPPNSRLSSLVVRSLLELDDKLKEDCDPSWFLSENANSLLRPLYILQNFWDVYCPLSRIAHHLEEYARILEEFPLGERINKLAVLQLAYIGFQILDHLPSEWNECSGEELTRRKTFLESNPQAQTLDFREYFFREIPWSMFQYICAINPEDYREETYTALQESLHEFKQLQEMLSFLKRQESILWRSSTEIIKLAFEKFRVLAFPNIMYLGTYFKDFIHIIHFHRVFETLENSLHNADYTTELKNYSILRAIQSVGEDLKNFSPQFLRFLGLPQEFIRTLIDLRDKLSHMEYKTGQDNRTVGDMVRSIAQNHNAFLVRCFRELEIIRDAYTNWPDTWVRVADIYKGELPITTRTAPFYELVRLKFLLERGVSLEDEEKVLVTLPQDSDVRKRLAIEVRDVLLNSARSLPPQDEFYAIIYKLGLSKTQATTLEKLYKKRKTHGSLSEEDCNRFKNVIEKVRPFDPSRNYQWTRKIFEFNSWESFEKALREAVPLSLEQVSLWRQYYETYRSASANASNSNQSPLYTLIEACRFVASNLIDTYEVILSLTRPFYPQNLRNISHWNPPNRYEDSFEGDHLIAYALEFCLSSFRESLKKLLAEMEILRNYSQLENLSNLFSGPDGQVCSDLEEVFQRAIRIAHNGDIKLNTVFNRFKGTLYDFIELSLVRGYQISVIEGTEVASYEGQDNLRPKYGPPSHESSLLEKLRNFMSSLQERQQRIMNLSTAEQSLTVPQLRQLQFMQSFAGAMMEGILDPMGASRKRLRHERLIEEREEIEKRLKTSLDLNEMVNSGEDIFAAKRRQSQEYTLHSNGQEVRFQSHQVSADGNCGFTTIGISRERAVNLLLSAIDREEIRRLVVPEIEAAVYEHAIPPEMQNARYTLLIHAQEKIDQLVREENDNIGLEGRDRKDAQNLLHVLRRINPAKATELEILINQLNIESYSIDPTTYELFVKYYIGKNGWLSYLPGAAGRTTSLDALAELNNMNIVIFEPVNEDSSQIREVYKTASDREGRNTIYMLHMNQRTHYELLEILNH